MQAVLCTATLIQ